MLRPKYKLGSAAFAAAGICAAAFAAAAFAPVEARAEAGLASPICEILKKMIPEVKTYMPEGARAQLVMEVSEKLDYDPAKLRQFKADADKTAGAECPKERDEMLAIVKLKSLSATFD